MSVYGVIFGLHFFGIFPHSDWLRISSYSTRMWINADQHNSEHGHFLRIAYIIHLHNIQVVAWNYKSVIQGGFIWQEVSGTSINLFEVRCNGHLMNYFSLMRHCGINTNLHAFFLSNTLMQCQVEIDKKFSKCKATRWGWTFAIWKLFTFFIHLVIQK